MALEIPGYKIIRQIGAGGMATVHLAVQEALDREVALKIMASQVTGDDAQFEERFIREGRSIAKLTHPSIVGVFDMGNANGHFYIAMEYLNGGSLKDRIQAGLTADESLEIIKSVALSLGFAHSKGYVHRDVKPMNILFREDGTPILTDFGIAKIVLDTGSELTSTGLIMGTPSYMSPEQAKGEVADGRADLYSLGIVLHEMFIGRVPFKADTAIAVLMKHVNDAIPQLPPHLTQYQFIIDRLLAKDPNERFQTSKDLIDAIDNREALFQETCIRPAHSSKGQPTEGLTSIGSSTSDPVSGSSSSAVKIIGSLVVLAGLAGGGYLGYDYWLEQKKNQPVKTVSTVVAQPVDVPKSVEVQIPNAFTNLANVKTKQAFKVLEKEYAVFEKQHPNHDLIASLEFDLIAQYLEVIEANMQSKAFDSANSVMSFALIHHADDTRLVALQKMLKQKMLITKKVDNTPVKPSVNPDVTTTEVVEESKENKMTHLFLSTRFDSAERDALIQMLRDTITSDPQNTFALNLRTKLTNEYFSEAQKLKLLDELIDASEMVKKGLLIDKNNQQLASLSEQIQAEQSEQKNARLKASKIQALLSSATKLKKSDQQSQSLIDIYHQVLAVDPNSYEAKKGLEDISRHLYNHSESLFREKKYDESLASIEKGLRMRPDDSKLSELKQTVTQQRSLSDANNQRQSEISSLLSRAEKYHQALKLIGPKEDAYDMYQKILTIDPSNRAAKQGLRKIADELESLAKVRLSVDDRTASLSLVKKGLRVYPSHEGLKSLQLKLQKKPTSSIFAPFSGSESQRKHTGPDIIFGK
ncbi:MAG: protein kinase [Methylococcales bacterium]|jgi:serine/threonine-protein kinase PpkA|nr:protein kinase [Methylococcales bacterium]MBT7445418.1 protein kinase [Methylococcales bacterium]